jgi:hypothetical protein
LTQHDCTRRTTWRSTHLLSRRSLLAKYRSVPMFSSPTPVTKALRNLRRFSWKSQLLEGTVWGHPIRNFSKSVKECSTCRRSRDTCSVTVTEQTARKVARAPQIFVKSPPPPQWISWKSKHNSFAYNRSQTDRHGLRTGRPSLLCK